MGKEEGGNAQEKKMHQKNSCVVFDYDRGG